MALKQHENSSRTRPVQQQHHRATHDDVDAELLAEDQHTGPPPEYTPYPEGDNPEAEEHGLAKDLAWAKRPAQSGAGTAAELPVQYLLFRTKRVSDEHSHPS